MYINKLQAISLISMKWISGSAERLINY